MKSLFKTVALITFFSILTRIIGFFFRIYLSRTIGAEGVGMYQVASSIFFVLMTVVASGLPLIISRMGAGFKAKKQEKQEKSLVSTALIFALLLSVILCLTVLLLKGLFAKMFTDQRCVEILIVMLPSIIFSAVYCVFRGALWGQGNYFALCVSELFEQVFRIFVCVLMLGASLSAIENALSVGWSMTIACLASMLFVIVLFFFYGGKMGKPSKQIFKPLFKQSTPITGIRVAGSFIQPLIALIIPARLTAIGYTSSQALSMYGVAVGMTMPLLFVPITIIGSLSTALIPDLSSAVAQGDKKHIENRVRSSIVFSLFVSAMFVPVYLGIGELAGLFLYDNALSGTLLVSASWVLIPMGLTNITSAILNSLGYEIKSFVNYIVGAVFMFIALWFLPPLIGINSMIWGMGISYVVTAILNCVMIKKKTGLTLNIFKPILIISLLSLPAAALSYFSCSVSNFIFPDFIALCIGGIVGVGALLLLCAVFNLIDIRWLIVQVNEKLGVSKKKKSKKSVA